MSFTTRCPACATTFKVVADQLKISDGWVRCGHCADVFDATLFLEDDGSVGASLPQFPKTSPAAKAQTFKPVGSRSLRVPATGLGTESDDAAGEWLTSPTSKEGRVTVSDGSTARSPSAQATEVLTSSTSVDSKPDHGDPGDSLPNADVRPQDAAVRDFTDSDLDALPELEPSFVRQARRRAFWHSRGMRAGLVVLSLLLSVSLLWQYLVHDRDQLAARYPAANALLALLCQPVGCQTGPVKQIDAVVIDSSNLVKRLGNFYSFDFVIKNQAQVPVAVPSLELSLTDVRDQVIVRRVFAPEELPGAPQQLAAQGNLSMSLRLSIADNRVSSMSGYRALVFYP